MRGLDKDYPEQDFEIQMPDTGEGLLISFDHQGYTTGVLYALKQGWTVDPESNETVQIGYIHQAKICDKGKMNKFKELEVCVNEDETKVQEEKVAGASTEAVEASTDAKSSTESEKGVDFEGLASLPNTKENRTKIDNIAKDEFGIEIDRRKFKTVKAIVKEFEQAYSEL